MESSSGGGWCWTGYGAQLDVEELDELQGDDGVSDGERREAEQKDEAREGRGAHLLVVLPDFGPGVSAGKRAR